MPGELPVALTSRCFRGELSDHSLSLVLCRMRLSDGLSGAKWRNPGAEAECLPESVSKELRSLYLDGVHLLVLFLCY